MVSTSQLSGLHASIRVPTRLHVVGPMPVVTGPANADPSTSATKSSMAHGPPGPAGMHDTFQHSATAPFPPSMGLRASQTLARAAHHDCTTPGLGGARAIRGTAKTLPMRRRLP